MFYHYFKGALATSSPYYLKLEAKNDFCAIVSAAN